MCLPWSHAVLKNLHSKLQNIFQLNQLNTMQCSTWNWKECWIIKDDHENPFDGTSNWISYYCTCLSYGHCSVCFVFKMCWEFTLHWKLVEIQGVSCIWKWDLKKLVVRTQSRETIWLWEFYWKTCERDQTGMKKNIKYKQRAAGWSHVL